MGKLSPIQLLKAVKNETESRGMRAAHVRKQREAGEKDGWRAVHLFDSVRPTSSFLYFCLPLFAFSALRLWPTRRVLTKPTFAPSKTLAYTESLIPSLVAFIKLGRNPNSVSVFVAFLCPTLLFSLFLSLSLSRSETALLCVSICAGWRRG